MTYDEAKAGAVVTQIKRDYNGLGQMTRLVTMIQKHKKPCASVYSSPGKPIWDRVPTYYDW